MTPPRSDHPPRILHFPTETGGNPHGLAAAQRTLGARAEVVAIRPPVFDHPADRVLTRARSTKPERIAARLAFAASAPWRYDIFHLNFAQGLLPWTLTRGLEATLLRACSKRTFMTFMGSDIRTSTRADHQPALLPDDSGDPVYHPDDDRAKHNAIETAQRVCDKTFALNPDLCARAGAEFLPYTNADPRTLTPRTTPREPGPLRIAHAPTKRAVKGTPSILRAIEALGHRAELILIENQSHQHTIEQCARADLLIDQLRIGWYGGLAVEAMCMGIPVIAHINDDDLTHIPRAMAHELPIIRATPSTIQSTLTQLIADQDALPELAATSRTFAQRWHDPLPIAHRILQLYRDPTLPLWPNTDQPLPHPQTHTQHEHHTTPTPTHPPDQTSSFV